MLGVCTCKQQPQIVAALIERRRRQRPQQQQQRQRRRRLRRRSCCCCCYCCRCKVASSISTVVRCVPKLHPPRVKHQKGSLSWKCAPQEQLESSSDNSSIVQLPTSSKRVRGDDDVDDTTRKTVSQQCVSDARAFCTLGKTQQQQQQQLCGAGGHTKSEATMKQAHATKDTWTNMIIGSKQFRLPSIQDELLLVPAHKLSHRIKDGSLKSETVIEAYIERIRQVQPHINAMCEDRFEDARREARAIDALLDEFRSGRKPEGEFTSEQLEMLRSPLLGVPVSIKESIGVRDMRHSAGLYDRRDTRAQSDAVVVRNARRYGMVPICTTNVPEGTLFWADCRNTVYGRTLNPYDLTRVTGASSGGEGALLAAAGSVVGMGSDIGGSLRIPAHFCGINSHKPSPFLVSTQGNWPPVYGSRLRLFTLGPMCRYASDLRPMLKCMLLDALDEDNKRNQDKNLDETIEQDEQTRLLHLQMTNKFKPTNINELRRQVLTKLDEPIDLCQIKLFYFNFNTESKLKGRRKLHVQREIMDAQQEVIDHFRSKFSCQVQHVDLDKFLKKTLVTWQCMMLGAGVEGEREQDYDEHRFESEFGLQNSAVLELMKLALGASKHTKEAVLASLVGIVVPRDRSKAFPMGERFERHAEEMRRELDELLGDNGVLVVPTLPSIAYKHHHALIKTPDLRHVALFNVCQMPVSCATFKIDKKHRMPFGFSFATRVYNDHIGITVAEEVELAFGGWQPPTPAGVTAEADNTNKAQQQQQQQQQTKLTTNTISNVLKSTETHQQQQQVTC